MHLDGRLTGERGTHFLAYAGDVRRSLLHRGIDQLQQERLYVIAHELRRNRRNGERISGKALDVETDPAQFLDVRFQHRTLGRADLEKDRRQELLRDRHAPPDSPQITFEPQAPMTRMLSYESYTVSRNDHDVAHSVLADQPAVDAAQ